jgi:hypothetical protein
MTALTKTKTCNAQKFVRHNCIYTYITWYVGRRNEDIIENCFKMKDDKFKDFSVLMNAFHKMM